MCLEHIRRFATFVKNRMITGIVEVTQDPEQAGSTLKILSLRLRGMKGSLEEMGEEVDENVENISKMQGQVLNLTKGKVNIFDGAGEFRSTYEIMRDIASVWDELNSKAQADLLETIAGKHRANSVAALLSNWQNVEEAVKSANEAEGSAAKENAKYVESLQGRLDKLTTAWQSFANTFMNSDLLKGGVSTLTTFVELIEKLVKSLGSFGTIGLGAGIFGLFKSKGTGLKSNIFGALSNFSSVVSDVLSSGDGLIKKFKGIGKAAGSASGSIIKSFGGSLSAATAGIGLLVAGIGLVINLYKNYREEISKSRQETIQASNEFLDASSSFEQAYIKYSGKTSLTSDEEAELSSAIKGTVDALDDKSSALQSIVNGSNDYLASLEAIKNAELEAANRAAVSKRDNAELELKDLVKGWSGLDGSEVGINISSTEVGAAEILNGMNSKFDIGLGDGRYENTMYSGRINLDANANANEIVEYYNFLLDYREKLSNAGLVDTAAYKDATVVIEKMSEAVGVYTDGVYDAAKSQYQLSNGIPKTTEAYIAMREAILNSDDIKNLSLDTKMSVLNSLDSEYGQLFDLSSAEVQARKFVGIIKGFGDGTKDGTNEIGTVETFLNMRTAVNSNECTVGEYLSELDNVKAMTVGWSDKEREEFNLSFGIDTDSIKSQYDDVYNYISRNYLNNLYNDGISNGMTMFNAREYRDTEIERIQSLLDSLSMTELQAVASIKAEIDWKTTSTDDILKQIKEEAKFLEAMNYTIAIDVEAESLEAVNTAMAESVSGAGLSSEAISALKGRYAELESEGYSLSDMFEETANGIHLNREAVGELEQKLASNKLTETDKQLKVLKGRYDELTNEINDCGDAGDKAALYTEQQSIVEKINDLATLASQYRGLTSAYNAWQNAESAGSERDMYESVIEGFENIGDEISRGWIDDGTIKFLELLTGKTGLAGKSGKDLKKIYDDLDDTIKNTTYSVRDFFTVDEDGNSTNTGVYNFLDAISQLEKTDVKSSVLDKTFKEIEGIENLIKKDENGNIISFDFGIVGGDKAIADALGISEELVQIMVRAADDAGFVVDLEGAYTQLADLKTEAESARDTLISLQKNGLEKLKGVDIDFNFEAEGQDLVDEQAKAVKLLDKFKKDGKIDLKMEGAQQALDIAEYLTIKLDDLTEPKIMQIDVSEVDEDLRDPIEKMQEIVKLSKEKNLVSLTGDKKEIKETQNEINKVAEELEELKPEIKAKVGIDDKWDAETIASKIEKGEVEIPASLELDVQMSDDLKDMRLMMMNQLGLVSDDEVKLKIGFDIDDSTVSELTDEQKEVAVKYIVENEDEFNKYTEEEKETVVKLIADGVDLEKYEAEDKEAIVNYIANGEEAEGWTPEAKDAFVKYLADGGEIDKFDPENKDSWVVYDTDTTKPDSYEADDEDATVTYDKDSSVPDGYDPNDPDATVTYKKDTSDIDDYNPPNFIRTVTYKIKEIVSKVASGGKSKAAQRTGADPDGKGGVNGTANVNGTTGRAFKQGSWGTKDSGTALVGELGREVLIRGGRYFTVGDYGAEFIKYQRGDIILNHVQSEELFKNGKVTSGGGRAKALASGTAFSKGSGGLGKVVVPVDIDGNGGVAKTTTKTSTKSSKNKTTTTTTTTTTSSKGSGGLEKASGKSVADKDDNKSSSSSSASKDFKETFDWIEVKINRIERAIDQLDQKANNVYKSWSSRNSALASEIGKVRDEIEIQQAGYERYLKEANSVGLSSSWAERVREGKVDINTIKDEKLAEKIRDFQTWYEKALDCKDAIEELKETEAKLYAQRVENVATQYEGILGVIEHEKNILDEYISQSEANAQLISVNYYNALAKNERENLAKLEEEKAKMLAEMQVAMDSGTITEGSESWHDLVASIDEVTLAIAESNTQLIEYAQTIQQLSWERFDLLQEKISAVTEETEFLIELLSSNKLFEDGGQLTDSGKATMGQHGVAYNTYMYQADLAAEEAERLKKQLEEDHYDTELEERYREMVSLQQEYILSAQQEKEAIRNLVEEGIELEIEALEERIDKYNEALDSQRELYDYQKRVKEQTEEIASLEKQMMAYNGDDSEETKAKIQELKVSLDEAKTDLQETEYDKYISDAQQMLDELSLRYSEILNTRLDDISALMTDMIAEINSDSTIISDTIRETADSVGYTLSDSMTSIWDTNSTKINDVITVYGEKFSSAQTTTNNALSTINTNLQNMITQLNSIAKTNVKSASTSSAAKSKEASSKKETPKKETPKKDTSKSSTIKVGGKINAKGAKIYDYVGDKSGERQLYRNDPIYKVLEERNGYLKTRWHKLSKGVTGWFKKGDVKAYATGKKNFANNEIAWTQENGLEEYIVRPSDGAILTPIARKGSVLNAQASDNLWNMTNSPAEFIKDNLNLGSTNVPNNSNVQSVYHQTIENVTFDFKNVKNYEEMLCSLRDDRRFEKLVTAMTIDRIAGKSALAKGKSIRN